MELEIIKHVASEISCIIGLATVCGTIIVVIFLKYYYRNEKEKNK